MIATETIRNLIELEHGDGSQFIRELEQLFLEQTPQLLSQIRVGLDQGNNKAVFGGAHRLKSTCAYLGIDNMADLCEKIENWTIASERSLLEAEYYLSSLEILFRDAQLELREVIDRLTSEL